MARCIVLGRFQPFHFGHAGLVQAAVQHAEGDEVVVAIGSAQAGWEADNPWTAEERQAMIEAWATEQGVDDAWRTALKDKYDTQVIGGQDHLKGKMFRVGSMGETPVAEMIEGCKRMLGCFRDFGVELNDVDVESYFG